MTAGRIALATVLNDIIPQSCKQNQVPVIQLLTSLPSQCWKNARFFDIILSLRVSQGGNSVPDTLVSQGKRACSIPKAMDSLADNQGNLEKEAEGRGCEPMVFDLKIQKTKEVKGFDDYGNAKFVILASGDFSNDAAYFDSLVGGNEIKLPDGAALQKESQIAENLPDDCHFNGDFYLRSLVTKQFGRSLLWSPCLPSTQTLLSQNFHLFPHGTVCVADVQLHGKGRSGNLWDSPQGCLMFSFTVHMENGRLLPFLQYVVSIALIEAIDSVSLKKGLPVLPVKIKWPNDLYANEMKIGGVLCTSTYGDKRFKVVVGVGLNVSNQKPTACLNSLLQDLVPSAPPFGKEELLGSFFGKFEDLLQVLLSEGFGPLESSYYEKWLHSGQKVILEEKQDDDTISGVSLVVQGLSPTGYLLATDEQMEKYELHPDGNSFDFLRGLVRKKLQA